MDTEVHTDTSTVTISSTRLGAAGSCGVEGNEINIEDSTLYEAYMIRKCRRKEDYEQSGSTLSLVEWCRSEGIDPVTYMYTDKSRRRPQGDDTPVAERLEQDTQPDTDRDTTQSEEVVWDKDTWLQVSLYLFNNHPALHHPADGGVDSTPEERKALVWDLCRDVKDAGVRITPAAFMDRIGINKCSYTFGMMHRKHFLRDLPDNNLIAIQDREDDAA